MNKKKVIMLYFEVGRGWQIKQVRIIMIIIQRGKKLIINTMVIIMILKVCQ